MQIVYKASLNCHFHIPPIVFNVRHNSTYVQRNSLGLWVRILCLNKEKLNLILKQNTSRYLRILKEICYTLVKFVISSFD
jgi:hypothetical protein